MEHNTIGFQPFSMLDSCCKEQRRAVCLAICTGADVGRLGLAGPSRQTSCCNVCRYFALDPSRYVRADKQNRDRSESILVQTSSCGDSF